MKKSPAFIYSILFWILFIACLYGSGRILAMFPFPWFKSGYILVVMALTILIPWLFARYAKTSRKEMGLVWEPATPARFFKGVLIGLIIFALIVVVLLTVGNLRLQYNNAPLNWQSIPVYLAILPFAFMEEVIFRSYTFLQLNRAFGLWVTQCIVAIAFALYHVAGGWSVYSAFMGPGIWAFVFGLAAVWSGGIAMPTGLHAALNVSQVIIGMKGAEHSVWVLSQKPGTASQADRVGVVIHLVILIVSIVLTGLVQKRKSRPHM